MGHVSALRNESRILLQSLQSLQSPLQSHRGIHSRGLLQICSCSLLHVRSRVMVSGKDQEKEPGSRVNIWS